jgi:fatty acid desaturase
MFIGARRLQARPCAQSAPCCYAGIILRISVLEFFGIRRGMYGTRGRFSRAGVCIKRSRHIGRTIVFSAEHRMGLIIDVVLPVTSGARLAVIAHHAMIVAQIGCLAPAEPGFGCLVISAWRFAIASLFAEVLFALWVLVGFFLRHRESPLSGEPMAEADARSR